MADGKIYVADRRGNRIQVFDHQGKFLAEKIIAPATLSSGSAFVGRGGRQAGQMLRPHGMGIDNQGNLYVGEASTGRRVQKFALQRSR